MKTIRTVIIVDPMASMNRTHEEEIEDILAMVEFDLEGADVNLVASGTGAHILKDIVPDLVVFDYGGMLPGTDMPEWQTGEIIRWAREHPQRLVWLYSTHTRRLYEDEFESASEHLANVLFRFDKDHMGKEVIARIRAWFGLTKEDYA